MKKKLLEISKKLGLLARHSDLNDVTKRELANVIKNSGYPIMTAKALRFFEFAVNHLPFEIGGGLIFNNKGELEGCALRFGKIKRKSGTPEHLGIGVSTSGNIEFRFHTHIQRANRKYSPPSPTDMTGFLKDVFRQFRENRPLSKANLIFTQKYIYAVYLSDMLKTKLYGSVPSAFSRLIKQIHAKEKTFRKFAGKQNLLNDESYHDGLLNVYRDSGFKIDVYKWNEPIVLSEKPTVFVEKMN